MALNTATGSANGAVGDDLYNDITQAAEFVNQEYSNLRELCVPYDFVGTEGLSAHVPVWADPGPAEELDENTAMTDDDKVTAGHVLITAKEYGKKQSVNDLVSEGARDNVISSVGSILGGSLAEAMDKSIVDEFTNFADADAVGAAGTTFSYSLISRAMTALRNKSANLDSVVGVFHPNQTRVLRESFIGNGANDVSQSPELANAVGRGYYLGQVAGCHIVESPLISVDSNDDAIGAVFTMRTFGIMYKRMFRVEPFRNPGARRTELNATGVWGVKILDTAKGVKVTADAS